MREKHLDPAFACFPPGVITSGWVVGEGAAAFGRSASGAWDAGITEIRWDPSPIWQPPGDIFGALGWCSSGSGETVPNLFLMILGSIGGRPGEVSGVKSGGVSGFLGAV